ncbi:hypothetical protein CTEN210_18113 [Chaetoceros tenuissimus]|uniref:GYF domain-containing protein n=1 Tax=Chaetoceros tenuissimus TaxID=426638 RepID=A0AAD3HF53_9STRA|nr:hypothetical protein CTEN210_18113 [Chaetoceros tenuissimus]
MSSPSSQPRLGPAWRSSSSGGRGFQPPAEDSSNQNRNSFSLLDMDEETPSSKPKVAVPDSPKRFSSRSEGLRSAGATGGAFQKKGRSLADLASRFPSSGKDRERSTGHSNRSERDGHHKSSSSGYLKDFVDDKKVIRYTRERLLSMRPRVESDAVRPDVLKVLDGIGVLSDVPLDPVCWDSFDADEIWNHARERNSRNKSSSTGNPRQDSTSSSTSTKDRPHSRPREGSSWQRGVALPPAERKNQREASNPDDLWDDPSMPTEAAADFSAFGGSLEDDPVSSSGGFDLVSMAEATKAFDDQVRGNTSTSENFESHDHAINPTRPLASAGTTIRSGSGDDVNVFEDFDAPNANNDAVKSGNVESTSASSRLMQMIGVEGTDVMNKEPQVDTSGNTTGDNFNIGGFNSIPSISSNPWGAPMPSTTTTANNDSSNTGLDLAAKIRESTNMEMEMRRKQEEERQRAAALEAQRQAAIQSQQQQQAQQAQPEYSSVELILCERVSTILENSWGRSDLMTILQTLHNDDARVVPLLGTVEALKALLQRHPHRFGLTKDPTFGAEMAVLIMNNAQYTQQKANEELKKRQEEEQLKMREAEAKAREQVVITDDPWFYADPQGNIQGPFKGNEMRQWLEAGYFKGDLPISQNQNGGFRQLASLFPDLSVAFKPTVSGPSEEELRQMEAAKQRAEAREIAERAERERLMKEQQEKEAAAAAEAARMAAVAAEAQSNQNQSAQLKMMLGLGSAGVSADVIGVASQPPVDVVEPVPAAQDRPEKDVAPSSPQSKPKSKANKEVEAAVSKEEPVAATPAAAPATPAWGGASSKPTENKKKSMSEIQKEEARVSAKVAKEKASQSSGGGWAGIAASGGTTAWSGTTAKATPAIVSSGPTTSTTRRSSTAQKSKPSSTNSTQETLQQFGADDKMTPDLENWCKQQMKKLNGSEDLTLVAFCMTLSDPMEIKQYLTAYLGSTPQVNNFASEFISRKNGTKQQEQWETTSKKNRKKKSAK